MTKHHTVILQVIDQGKGTPPENKEGRAPEWMVAYGVGLRGMNERIVQLGGNLQITSTREGTTVTASLPLPAENVDGQLEK